MSAIPQQDVQDATTLVLKVCGRLAIFAICLAQAAENASSGHPFYGIFWIWLAGLLVLPNVGSKLEVNINTTKKPENTAAEANFESESDEDEEDDDEDEDVAANTGAAPDVVSTAADSAESEHKMT